MSFDKIIANPPFDKNLHLKILREAMKHIEKEGGEIVCLHPNSFRTHLSQYINKMPYSKYVCEHLINVDIIEHNDMNGLFGTGNSIEEGIIGTYIPNVTAADKILPLPYSDELVNIEMKIKNKTKSPASGFNKSTEPWCRHKREELKEPYVLLDVWGQKLADESSKAHYGIQFETEEEKRNFIDYFNNSWVTKFHLKMDGMPGLYYIVDGYHKPWTDTDLYEYFNLTPEEIKEIENAI
jgi:hypothetical protein